MGERESLAIVGIGRMGQVLAEQLNRHFTLYLYDRDPHHTARMAASLGAVACASLADTVTAGTVILAVPDSEVVNCLKEYNGLGVPVRIINIATNVFQSVLAQLAGPGVVCTSAKFIGHAGEMALGQRPLIVIHPMPAEMVAVARRIFQVIGDVVVADADMVSRINTLAVEKALEAGVIIETGLRRQGVTDERVIKSAIQQVAAGTLKAFAVSDLGPFAREIVRAIRAKLR